MHLSKARRRKATGRYHLHCQFPSPYAQQRMFKAGGGTQGQSQGNGCSQVNLCCHTICHIWGRKVSTVCKVLAVLLIHVSRLTHWSLTAHDGITTCICHMFLNESGCRCTCAFSSSSFLTSPPWWLSPTRLPCPPTKATSGGSILSFLT